MQSPKEHTESCQKTVTTACGASQVFLVPFNDNKPRALQRARFTDDGVLEVRTGARPQHRRSLWRVSQAADGSRSAGLSEECHADQGGAAQKGNVRVCAGVARSGAAGGRRGRGRALLHLGRLLHACATLLCIVPPWRSRALLPTAQGSPCMTCHVQLLLPRMKTARTADAATCCVIYVRQGPRHGAHSGSDAGLA